MLEVNHLYICDILTDDQKLLLYHKYCDKIVGYISDCTVKYLLDNHKHALIEKHMKSINYQTTCAQCITQLKRCAPSNEPKSESYITYIFNRLFSLFRKN